LLGAALTACVWFMWRGRIPFAAALLSTVASVTKRWPATIFVCFVALLVQVIWSGIWGFATATSSLYATSVGLSVLLYVYFLFSFFWTSEVIRNSAHTTNAGLFATWYFLGDQAPRNPTAGAAKRALTTSFGSICFGSLIVAVIQTVRAILRSLQRRNSGNIAVVICACIIDCILGCIESLVRYFNRYAYIQCAIYGKSFCQAAKDTWRLVQSHGIDAMVNDSMIGPVLTCGVLLAGVVCFGVGALVGLAVTKSSAINPGPYTWVLFGLVGAVIGLVSMAQAMSVVRSGVDTIFVCFAMDQAALARHDAALAQYFAAAYSGDAARLQREAYK